MNFLLSGSCLAVLVVRLRKVWRRDNSGWLEVRLRQLQALPLTFSVPGQPYGQGRDLGLRLALLHGGC